MPYCAWIPHLATDLEIATRHINDGDEVHIIQCSGDLASCEPNPNHFKLTCMLCKSKRNKGLNLIGLPVQNRHDLALNRFEVDLDLPDILSIQELKAFEIDNVDFGMAVASTLISMTREPYPDVNKYKNFMYKNLFMSIAVYKSIKYNLTKIKPDIFYLFNGRYAAFRPALRAAQELKIKTFVHERAGVLQRYDLIEDTYPHDIEYQKNQIEINWNDDLTLIEKKKIAQQWFEDRRSGRDQGWYSYTKSQKKKFLPENFETSKRNIAIFISSEDEFEAIEGWQNPIYKNQSDAIDAIINSNIDKNIIFYVRIHPNLKGLNNTQTRKLSKLKASNLTVITADSKIDSYKLMKECEKVITFGSTIGIESIFWGKPSILIGRAIYEDLEGCYIPKNHGEVVDMINRLLTSSSNMGALKYGYWQSVYGIPYLYYTPESIRGGKFKGIYLQSPVTDRVKDKILSIDRFSLPLINLIRKIRKWTWKIRSTN